MRALRLVQDTQAIQERIEEAIDGSLRVDHIPGRPVVQGPITAASARIDVTDPNNAITTSAVARYARSWQRAAWDYVEAIGEIRFGFGALAASGSRAVLQGAILDDPTKPPVTLTAIKDSDPHYQQIGGQTRQCMARANEIAADLRPLLSTMLLNLQVSGEYYLTYVDAQWVVLSSEELIPVNANGEILTEVQIQRMTRERRTSEVRWAMRRDRNRPPVPLDPKAYLARIWRAHPRWQQEPSSSMIGVLDQCESLLLLDQMIRTTTRSRLFAGAMFVPDSVSGTNEDSSLESDLTEAALLSVTKEDAAYAVTPLVLTGPPEDGKEIRHISLSRGLDEPTIALLDRVLDRILTGIDLPKEFVRGLGSAKYANAVVLEEGMYRMHIAPLLELICEALTRVYLRPRLLRDGYAQALVDKMVMWFDPVNIVTRPDAGQAANDGFDRKVLSAAAWRTARGFSEADAPSEDEQYRRLMREKGIIPPDAAAAFVEFAGGQGLRSARKYVETINADTGQPSGSPVATPREEAAGQQEAGQGPGTGSNQNTGPQAQEPAEPGAPSTPLPLELQEILGPTAEKGGNTPRDRTTVPGSDRRPGEMLPPRR